MAALMHGARAEYDAHAQNSIIIQGGSRTKTLVTSAMPRSHGRSRRSYNDTTASANIKLISPHRPGTVRCGRESEKLISGKENRLA